jgi:hypothetical protein
MASRAVVLAVVLGAGAGVLSLDTTNPLAPVLVVVAGAVTVGGLAPRALWWLGTLVGVAVPLVRLAAGSVSSESSTREWLALVLLVGIAAAASGLGAALKRLSGYGQDQE